MKTKIVISFSLLIILAVMAAVLAAGNGIDQPLKADPQTTLYSAGQAYDQKDFARARDLYQSLLDQGIVNGHLFYNLGNCYFRLGDIGRAILYYRRAQIYIPRDADLAANLGNAIQNRLDQLESGETGIKKVFFFWYYNLSWRELLYIFLGLNLLFWTALSVFLFQRRNWLRWLWIVLLVLWVFSGATALYKYAGSSGIHSGVVIEPEIEVRSGYSQNDTVLFKLHSGADFGVEGQERGWFKIHLPDGKRGWVNGDFVRIVEDLKSI